MLYGIIKRIPLDKHPLPNEFEQVAKSVERIGTSRKVIFDYVSAGRDLKYGFSYTLILYLCEISDIAIVV